MMDLKHRVSQTLNVRPSPVVQTSVSIIGSGLAIILCTSILAFSIMANFSSAPLRDGEAKSGSSTYSLIFGVPDESERDSGGEEETEEYAETNDEVAGATPKAKPPTVVETKRRWFWERDEDKVDPTKIQADRIIVVSRKRKCPWCDKQKVETAKLEAKGYKVQHVWQEDFNKGRTKNRVGPVPTTIFVEDGKFVGKYEGYKKAGDIETFLAPVKRTLGSSRAGNKQSWKKQSHKPWRSQP